MEEGLTASTDTAVVVGDVTVLGSAIARALTRDGFRVVLGGDVEADFVVDPGCVAVPIDVRSEASVRKFVSAVPRPSALIIVHGPRRSTSRQDADTDDWQWRWETNVLGMVRLTKGLLPALRAATDPTIVIIGPDERPDGPTANQDFDKPHFGTRTLHRLVEQEITGTAIRLSKVWHGPPAGAPVDAVPAMAGLRAADILSVASPALSAEIGEVVSFVVRGPASLFLEEISIRSSSALGALHRN